MRTDNVIILGAGASAAEGAPLQSDLFREYFRFQAEPAVAHEMDLELAAFFEAFFGIDLDDKGGNKLHFPTFEEVLGIIEIALQRNESFKGFGTWAGDPRLQRVREHLIFLICVILARMLEGKAVHHRRLISTLQRAGSLKQTCFISFNYDILIDNALVDTWQDCDLDYGVTFTNFEKADDWKRPRHERSVFLFKLHGSLNWLYCPTCTSLTLTPKEKGAIKLIYEPHACQCPCDANLIPIIIPPTFFKVMSNFHLQEIWRKAEQAMMSASRLIFCGYSLPDADMHVKYLIKRIEVNRGHTPDVYVVNEHERKCPSQRQDEIERYLRVFRDPAKVHFKKLSFQEFCEIGPDGIDRAPNLETSSRIHRAR